ncbi:hypothetical protein BDA96_03G190300 [Sorghum bicolor]|uniref:Uncharacterized protein n=1 Tax=Sorghum bicolor TaxID=4558 RepID=A0A921RET9_SORBI|nr:hypothetical protein BDA96_03G190300 [Sorghum bicolor]KAG0537923.1 hypothetical protein BDA96_03G190300 [Sorghum bicolor]
MTPHPGRLVLPPVAPSLLFPPPAVHHASFRRHGDSLLCCTAPPPGASLVRPLRLPPPAKVWARSAAAVPGCATMRYDESITFSGYISRSWVLRISSY